MAATVSRFLALVLCATAVAACDESQGTLVGPGGGVVVSDDGRLTVEIPARALDQTVDISIQAVEDGPDGERAALRAYAIEPLGTALVFPAYVEYDWTPQGSADAPTGPGEAHAPTMFIQHGPKWRALADRTIDRDAGYVSGSINYLGVVAILDEDTAG